MSITSSSPRAYVSRAFLCVFIRLSILKDAEWLAPSSPSNSVRMNGNNLLGHHS